MAVGTVEEIPGKMKLLRTRGTAIKKSKDQLTRGRRGYSGFAFIDRKFSGLFHECDRLHACHFKALAAAQVLAHDEIVAAHHVRAGLGEFRAIAFVSARWKLPFLGPNQPGELIFIGLLAVRTMKGVGFLGFFLVV